MKRNLLKGMAAVLAAAALTAVFAGCGGNKKDNGAAGKTADASSVKIGFITAYTGPGAAYGVAMKEGVDLAVEEINNNPKTKVKISENLRYQAGQGGSDQCHEKSDRAG